MSFKVYKHALFARLLYFGLPALLTLVVGILSLSFSMPFAVICLAAAAVFTVLAVRYVIRLKAIDSGVGELSDESLSSCIQNIEEMHFFYEDRLVTLEIPAVIRYRYIDEVSVRYLVLPKSLPYYLVSFTLSDGRKYRIRAHCNIMNKQEVRYRTAQAIDLIYAARPGLRINKTNF